jgi:hypothetical protein
LVSITEKSGNPAGKKKIHDQIPNSYPTRKENFSNRILLVETRQKNRSRHFLLGHEFYPSLGQGDRMSLRKNRPKCSPTNKKIHNLKSIGKNAAKNVSYFYNLQKTAQSKQSPNLVTLLSPWRKFFYSDEFFLLKMAFGKKMNEGEYPHKNTYIKTLADNFKLLFRNISPSVRVILW